MADGRCCGVCVCHVVGVLSEHLWRGAGWKAREGSRLRTERDSERPWKMKIPMALGQGQSASVCPDVPVSGAPRDGRPRACYFLLLMSRLITVQEIRDTKSG